MNFDTLELYRWAVQDPERQAAVLAHLYERLRNDRPRTLREDFAGTAADSVAWVAAGEDRRAVAVDREWRTLDWASRRAERLLGERSDRVEFIAADVLEVKPPSVPAADVISALNFSLLYFHDRQSLRDYFHQARSSLAPDGILVGNLFGGPGAMRRKTDVHRIVPNGSEENSPPPFEYRWEQRRYNAINARIDCRIHFAIDEPKGASAVIENAFVYDWRLWTLPEVVELMREAGFADAQVWRHTYDPALGREGVFMGVVRSIEGVDAWTAYVIGVR